MQLAAYVTPSHKRLYDLFIQTTGEFDNISVCRDKQRGNPVFGQGDWTHALRHKAKAMRDAIHACPEEFMLWSDVDVIFRLPVIDGLKQLMGSKYDVLAQPASNHQMCSGFFVVRINDATKNLAEQMADDEDSYKNSLGDQFAFNKFRDLVTWGLLPVNKFWTPGYLGKGRWRVATSVNVHPPKDWRVLHANWCVGVSLKLRIMQRFKRQCL